ncbi:MAG: hypothetical protein IPK78_09145 [Rhodospirillales bacterium]|nr:hypothetical protein [Rhodospirillales bacterium]
MARKQHRPRRQRGRRRRQDLLEGPGVTQSGDQVTAEPPHLARMIGIVGDHGTNRHYGDLRRRRLLLLH